MHEHRPDEAPRRGFHPDHVGRGPEREAAPDDGPAVGGSLFENQLLRTLKRERPAGPQGVRFGAFAGDERQGVFAQPASLRCIRRDQARPPPAVGRGGELDSCSRRAGESEDLILRTQERGGEKEKECGGKQSTEGIQSSHLTFERKATFQPPNIRRTAQRLCRWSSIL